MQKSEPKSGRWLSKTLPGPSCQRRSQCATWKRGQLQSCQRKSPLREESKELQNLFQKNTRNLPAQFCYWAGTWWHACCVSTSWPRLQKSDGNMVLINSWHLKAAFCCTSMRKLNCILIAWRSCGDLWIQADNQLVQLTISIWQKALAHIQSPVRLLSRKASFESKVLNCSLCVCCMLQKFATRQTIYSTLSAWRELPEITTSVLHDLLLGCRWLQAWRSCWSAILQTNFIGSAQKSSIFILTQIRRALEGQSPELWSDAQLQQTFSSMYL